MLCYLPTYLQAEEDCVEPDDREQHPLEGLRPGQAEHEQAQTALGGLLLNNTRHHRHSKQPARRE